MTDTERNPYFTIRASDVGREAVMADDYADLWKRLSDGEARYAELEELQRTTGRNALAWKAQAGGEYAIQLHYLLTIYQHAWKNDNRIPSNIEAQADAALAKNPTAGADSPLCGKH